MLNQTSRRERHTQPSLGSGRRGLSLLSVANFGVVLVELVTNPADDDVKGLGVVDRQLGQALAVEADVGQTQTMDQAAVAEPAFRRRQLRRVMNRRRN